MFNKVAIPQNNMQTMFVKYVFLFALALGLSATASGQIVAQGYEENVEREDERLALIERFALPALKEKDTFIHHYGFSLIYDSLHKQAQCVSYVLTKSETIKRVERSNHFEPDPQLSGITASSQDYTGSGYDRGHLAPAADMCWSKQSMEESFYFSNISPQVPAFNRGVWKKLEEQTRAWANETGALCIATGPVLEPNLLRIGANQLSVPRYYYKVLLDVQTATPKAIGFVLANQSSTLPLQNFTVSIDSVERLTGIDFFAALPDSIEQWVESQINLPSWNWNTTFTTPLAYAQTTHASQTCLGITRAGNPCVNKTRHPSGYCEHHLNQALETVTAGSQKSPSNTMSATQCTGYTQKGQRCKRMTTNKNGKCYQH